MASTAGQDMSVNAGRKKRRMFPVVDARFQWKYTLMITAIGAGVAIFMGLFLYQAHQENTEILKLFEDAGIREQVNRGDQIFLLYLVIFVLVMATALMLGGLIVTQMPDLPKGLFVFAGIDGVRFRRPVVPGDQLKISCELISLKRQRFGKVHAEAKVDGQLVCSGDLMFSLVD